MFGRMIGAAALLVACSVLPAQADCDARARAVWAGSHKGVVAEAMSQGATCENAVVTLVLREKSGKPIWAETFVGAQVMVFAGVSDRAAMTRALSEWIDQKGAMMPRTDKLPDWPKGADAPQGGGEFPFYPDGGIDREMYLKLRGAKLPMFCYVQGMESMGCVALEGDGITKVGLQTFPG
jgi:hypothetical protein